MHHFANFWAVWYLAGLKVRTALVVEPTPSGNELFQRDTMLIYEHHRILWEEQQCQRRTAGEDVFLCVRVFFFFAEGWA